MTSLRTLDHLEPEALRQRRILVRVDFNVPLEDGRVADETRLREALPTVRELCAAGARVVLLSHCGRPKGRPDPRDSLRPVATRFAELLEQPVAFAEDCVGEAAARVVDGLAGGEACVLENLRFHAGEKSSDEAFVDALAKLGEGFVGDAFGTAHRAHASVVALAERFEIKAAGRLMVREVEALSRLLEEPPRPFVGVLGGAKIDGKIETLENLLPRLDGLLLGGGMANTFLAARGLDLASSLVEEERLGLARDILDRAAAAETQVELPVDLVVTDDLEAPRRISTVASDAVPSGFMAVDVGEATRKRFASVVAKAGTLFWNGPLGVFEKPPFDAGTRHLAECLASCEGYTVVGGGETAAAVHRAGVADRVKHVSTGGGASLELLAGKPLPGVEVLALEP